MSDPITAPSAVAGGQSGLGPPAMPPPPESAVPSTERSASLWADARRQLLRNPVFVLATIYVLVVASMAVAPGMWTSQDPRNCDVTLSRRPPSSEHPFGYNVLGCDYYSHAIYGAQPSLTIAIFATMGIVVIGGVLGLLAGYYGGWLDGLISRFMDIFFSLPFLLGAIVFLTVIKRQNITTLAIVLVVLGWPTVARIIRGSVISARNLDYVHAAQAVGASNGRLMTRHILPNSIAPMMAS